MKKDDNVPYEIFKDLLNKAHINTLKKVSCIAISILEKRIKQALRGKYGAKIKEIPPLK